MALITPISAPYVAPYRPELTLPTDGSNGGALINSFIADCKNHGYSCGYLKPGYVTAEVAVNIPSQFDLIGMGKYDRGHGNWTGGAKIASPLNSITPAIAMLGNNTDRGNTLGGFINRPGLINMCIEGALQGAAAIAQAHPALIACKDVYALRMEHIYSGNDYVCALRLQNVWDSNIDDFWANSGGFSDPTASPSDPAVVNYTGRTAMGVETAIGRSLGVPCIDVYSPSTSYADNSNNIRFTNLFLESNAQNGVPLMVRGQNTNAIQIVSAKIEADEGCVPLIVLDGVMAFYYSGFLYAGGGGYPYTAVGSVPAGKAWSSYTTPGALVLANASVSPEIRGNGGYINNTNAGHPDSLFRFINCEDPKVNWTVVDGLTRLSSARMIFDNCKSVSTSRTRCFAPSYVLGTAGSNITERVLLNGTTTEA